MAQWRKVIVSGSNSELNHITSSGDLYLSTDGAQMKFGADREVTLTHVHNDGLLFIRMNLLTLDLAKAKLNLKAN